MPAATASRTAVVRRRVTAREGARICRVSCLECRVRVGSLVLTVRRTRLGQIDHVDRTVPTTYLLLPRSGPRDRPGCVRPPPGSRRRYETSSRHHHFPLGGALDGAALRPTTTWHDPGY